MFVIQFQRSYVVDNEAHVTLEKAQTAAIAKVTGITPENDVATVENKDMVMKILTMDDTARPGARGKTKKSKKTETPNPITE